MKKNIYLLKNVAHIHLALAMMASLFSISCAPCSAKQEKVYPPEQPTCDSQEHRLLAQYKNYFESIKNQLFRISVVEQLASLKLARYPNEFWNLFSLACKKNDFLIMHGLAHEYIKRVGNPSNDPFFTKQGSMDETTKDVIRKQYFLMTGDDGLLKKEDHTLTLTLSEVLASRPTKVVNSKLKLSGLHLGSIDDIEIYHASTLEELDLSDNSIEVIPESISKLTKMKYVNLSNNKISELPKSFANLQGIVRLNLSHNRFHTFPESICQLKNLWRLDMNHNKLTQIPESIQGLDKLHWAVLSNNQLTQLPASIKNLPALRKLDLSHNDLKSLPSYFADLYFLQSINLKGNQKLCLDTTTLPKTVNLQA